MRYEHVILENCTAFLPERRVTSDELEAELEPLYGRLHLSVGRLELMTGIAERRVWPAGTLPSQAATEAGRRALSRAGLSPSEIGCLVYCGVSRDFAEPATATAVHHGLGLSGDCRNFDISNACLGVASGMEVLAAMIELGQIDWGLAVTGENGWPLVANTVRVLNTDPSVTRQSLKSQFASLTIGSAAAAVLLRRDTLRPGGHRLRASATASDCGGCALCQGQADGAMTDGSAPLMHTDSTELMHQGIDVAARMWEKLCDESGWQAADIDVVCGHQVGKFHRNLLFERLGLPVEKDFPTFPLLGNCGSASLPATCALAEEAGVLRPGRRLAMLGIGSGINSLGFAIEW